MVVAAYEQGDPALMGLSMVFTTQDPAQLTGKLNADDTVVDVETAILDQLEAAKVLLQVKEDELADGQGRRRRRRREAAAENLAPQAGARAAGARGRSSRSPSWSPPGRRPRRPR